MMLFMIILILSNQIGISHGQLKVGFYDKKCPNVESIVSGVVKRFSASNKNIAPVLLRLHFHDCFVQVQLHNYVYLITFSDRSLNIK